MKLSDDPIGRSRKRTLSLLILLAVNAGMAHTLTSQIISSVSASAFMAVKDEQVSLETASGVDENTAPLPPLGEKATDGSHAITVYTVKSGDTIGGIAEEFRVSTNTIRWANNLGTKGTIKVGDTLTILPVTGVQYKVKKGDTASAIAKKYDADTREILDYNGLESASDLKVGMDIIIPDGEPIATAPTKTEAKAAVKAVTKNTAAKESDSKTTTTTSSEYKLPIPGSVLTQGHHGANSVDFGAPIGTTVVAAMKGEVIIAKGDGAYNGGYGSYIVIKHSNGTQTLYAHLSKVSVSVGDTVTAGEVIAKSGNTGRSTGPHLHFEVRGKTNPFSKYKVGTHF
ncbi:MAG TPA: peptidoglycan DD-metalloendopeptidase family protein [Candidatus Paceibacterota bacterium]